MGKRVNLRFWISRAILLLHFLPCFDILSNREPLQLKVQSIFQVIYNLENALHLIYYCAVLTFTSGLCSAIHPYLLPCPWTRLFLK